MRTRCLGSVDSVGSFCLSVVGASTNRFCAEYAAAFFLLADHLRDAVNVCINQLGDLQLAIAITRAYEGDDGPTLKEILEEKVLVEAAAEGNRWMASWAFWMLNRRGMAVRSLIVGLRRHVWSCRWLTIAFSRLLNL